MKRQLNGICTTLPKCDSNDCIGYPWFTPKRVLVVTEEMCYWRCNL